jgi:hypothetical protein
MKIEKKKKKKVYSLIFVDEKKKLGGNIGSIILVGG